MTEVTERLCKDGHDSPDLLLGRFIAAKYCNPVREIERRECSFCKKTLLKLVSDCSAVALNPSKKETASESPLKIALFSLAKMCSNHQICRQFVKSSELFPVIARLKHSP
ncbi:unnamed protein product [Brassica oleracea var. botrytis]|uniref:non-specific serine/threonine protein kinase n=1 Tax=Brassica napus TaxID=3708 RepID=A0A816Q3T9_BRANA|nr:unnamed protein product [Brassica napus]